MAKKSNDKLKGMSKDHYLADEICCYRPAENEELRSPHIMDWKTIPKFMDHRYYKPTVEELNVDFYFEAKITPFKIEKLEEGKVDWAAIPPIEWQTCRFMWEMMSMMPIPFHFLSLLSEDRIRVKYLDTEDIESFDFKLLEEEEEFLLFESYKTFLGAGTGDDRKLIISYNTYSKEIWLWWKENRGTETTIHEGYCKNKSELKKLLKDQLRIPHLDYQC